MAKIRRKVTLVALTVAPVAYIIIETAGLNRP